MTEQDFSKQVVSKLRSEGAFVQRFESEKMGVGIPDIYFKYRGLSQWLELKSMPRTKGFGHDRGWTIPWRKGQQAWAYELWRASGGQDCVITLCKLSDSILYVPMTSIYERGHVQYAHRVGSFRGIMSNVLVSVDLDAIVKVMLAYENKN
jgi:hypothetical protein